MANNTTKSHEDVGFEEEVPVKVAPNERYDLRCPDCGDFLRLTRLKFLGQEALVYGCRRYPMGCRGSLSAHKDGSPRGFPADAETRRWRRMAHETFDRLWSGKNAHTTKENAYVWLRRRFDLLEGQGIGYLDRQRCEKLIELVKADWPEHRTVWDRLLGNSF